MLKTLKYRPSTGLAVIAALALSGGALATHEPVPVSEAGRLSPEQLRGLLSGRVQVAERKAGSFQGTLLVRRFGADEGWTGCAITRKEGKVWHQTGGWSVAPDSRGRGKLFAHRHHRPGYHHHINPAVIHYEPDTGHFLWRVWPVGPHRLGLLKEDRGWIDWAEGWFQERWPQIAVDKCPELDVLGLAVDGRQTGATLEELRKQTPNAPLKDLAELLPPVPREAIQ